MAVFTRERYPEGKKAQLIPHYIGPMSTYPEWHSSIIGFYYSLNPKRVGLPNYLFDESHDRYNKDVAKEPDNAYAFYILGELFKTGFVLYFGIDAFNVL